MRRVLTLIALYIDAFIDKSDRQLFWQATQPGHSLHHLLLPKTSTYRSYQLSKRQHPYLLPTVQQSQFKNCYYNNHCLLLARLMGQYCFARWRMSSYVTLPAGGRAGRRACGRLSAAGPAAGRVGHRAADTARRASRVTSR